MEARRPHTATSSEAIYLSPCQLWNQQRLFNLDASEKLAWNRRQFFHLISCTAFWIWMNLVQVRQDHSRETCEEQEVEMDIIWNEENFMEARRPPHTTTSSKAIYLSPCQLCNQQRLFNLDASEKLAWNRRQFFHLISCTAFWIWMNLVQVRQDHSRETCEEQEVEMDIIWNEENFMEARRPPHTATSSEAIYLSPCQLCNQQRLFNLDASEKLAWNRRQFFPCS